MHNFFDSYTGRHGTFAIAPFVAPLAGAAFSAGAGFLGSSGAKKAQKGAIKDAGIQQGRDIVNQATLNDIARRQAKGEREQQDLGRVDSTFGVAEGGFNLGGEFITQAQARERGLIRDQQSQRMIAQPGDNTFVPFTETIVDPRLTKTTRTGLSPELESIRQQALNFQGVAGEQLGAGFQGIDEGLATRELDLLERLAAPREAEAREQLFGQLQRTGRLESTPGASIFRGAEEAFQRAGLQRELSAREIARSERDKSFQANLELFGTGNQTTQDMFNIEQGLADRLIQTSRSRPGGLAMTQQLPQLRPMFGGAPNTQQNLAALLGGFGSQIAGADLSRLFGGSGASGSTSGGDFLAKSLVSPSRSAQLFGDF